MKYNSPDIRAHSYLGYSPYSIAHACAKNQVQRSRFFKSANLTIPSHHRFWSSFEVDLISNYNNCFDFPENRREVLFKMPCMNVLLGKSVEDNILELRRKFPNFEELYLKERSRNEQLISVLEIDLLDIWMRISKHSHLESINFNEILNECENLLVHDLYNWFTGSFLGQKFNNERELIRALSLTYLGVDHKNFTSIQIFYLASKLVSVNYFFPCFDNIATSFDLITDISMPKLIMSNKVDILQSESFEALLIESDGYFGKTFSDRAFFCGIGDSVNYMGEVNKQYLVNKSHFFLIDSSLGRVIVNSSWDFFCLSHSSVLEVYSESEVSVCEAKVFDASALEVNDPQEKFYTLNDRKPKAYEINTSSISASKLISDCPVPGVSVKTLNDSHLLGNVSSLFYAP
jgi:hypothetical protein